MNINITLIGEMITFAIFVWFTMRYVWPPLKTAMNERNKVIADGLAFAERADKELELSQRKAKEFIQEAKAQAATIVEHANERAHKVDEQAKVDARISADRIKAAAMEDIETEKLKLKEDLKNEVAAIALAGAEKIIEKNIDEASNSKLLDKLVSEI